MHGPLNTKTPHTLETLSYVKLPNTQHNIPEDQKAQIQIRVCEDSVSILETVNFLRDRGFYFLLSSLVIICDNTSVQVITNYLNIPGSYTYFSLKKITFYKNAFEKAS
jgi:hypothetical protein